MPNCVTNKRLDELIEQTTSEINDALRELRRARKKLAQLAKKNETETVLITEELYKIIKQYL